jgi:hypothetical protein
MVIIALSVGKIKHILVCNFILQYPDVLFWQTDMWKPPEVIKEYLSQKQEGSPE